MYCDLKLTGQLFQRYLFKKAAIFYIQIVYAKINEDIKNIKQNLIQRGHKLAHIRRSLAYHITGHVKWAKLKRCSCLSNKNVGLLEQHAYKSVSSPHWLNLRLLWQMEA